MTRRLIGALVQRVRRRGSKGPVGAVNSGAPAFGSDVAASLTDEALAQVLERWSAGLL